MTTCAGSRIGPRLIHDRALDRLADPPRRVGREAEAALGVELVERVDEAEVAFLDQVGQREPAVGVVLRDADDEPQVVLDQPLPRREVAAGHRPGERELLLRRQEHVLPDLVEIDLRDIVDDVRAEAGGRLGQRQLLRPAIRLRTRRATARRRRRLRRACAADASSAGANAGQIELGVVPQRACAPRHGAHAGGR